MAEDPFADSTHQQHQPQQRHQQQPPHIHRPIPRRNFLTTSNSNSQSQTHSQDSPERWPQDTPPALYDPHSRSSEFLAQLNARLLRTNNNGNAHEHGYNTATEGGQPARNKSFLNMTTSTLFGIYDDMGSSTTGERSVADTPWGTGAETPARRSVDYGVGGSNGYENGMGSPDGGLKVKGLARRGAMETQRQNSRPRQSQRPQRYGIWRVFAIAGKLSALFLFGVTYGVIVSHLHDSRELAAVNLEGVDRESWIYLASWGLAGVSLGSLLPYIDLVCHGDRIESDTQEADTEKESGSSLGEQWNEVVRSVGAFMGIAFAIRRLPWQSTLQLTFTLALVNPALWYILDRSKLGFSFSLITTSILTSFIFLSNPNVLPSPALPATTNSTHLTASTRQTDRGELFAGVISYDNLATVTWVGSVIFCSCVCFGGIGRRLAVLDDWGRKR